MGDATISKFEAQPPGFPAGGGSVTLSWEVEGSFASLSIEGYDGQCGTDAKGSSPHK